MNPAKKAFREKVQAERNARLSGSNSPALSDNDIREAVAGMDDTAISEWAEDQWHRNQNLRAEFTSVQALSAYCRALNKNLITNSGNSAA